MKRNRYDVRLYDELTDTINKINTVLHLAVLLEPDEARDLDGRQGTRAAQLIAEADKDLLCRALAILFDYVDDALILIEEWWTEPGRTDQPEADQQPTTNHVSTQGEALCHAR